MSLDSLHNCPFCEEEIYDQNSYDNWWYFKHSELGTAIIDFNAECFELKLCKNEEE